MSSVACPAVQYFINGTIIRKKVLNTKCVFFIFYTAFSETFLIPRRIEPDIVSNAGRFPYQVPVILVRV
jgi:hypothetical protein